MSDGPPPEKTADQTNGCHLPGIHQLLHHYAPVGDVMNLNWGPICRRSLPDRSRAILSALSSDSWLELSGSHLGPGGDSLQSVGH